MPVALALSAALALAAAPSPTTAEQLALETYALPNGMTVILQPDHRLPQVVVDTWFGVGSADEVPGRTGFAHLFEHLMFMGTKRVPGNQFDVLMESGGGANNASTSEDRTNYYSWGPSSLLPTLLWLDADRFQALGANMTKEKVDLQRSVVRNERRQTTENTPYGVAELILPEALYPVGHPYHHPVIGSHADLEAASLDDVKQFFATWYVPGNATVVVAGDFEPAQVKPLVAQLFGAIPARPVPARAVPAPVKLDREVRRVATDHVELPKLYLAWHAPPAFAPGTAELQLLADVLGEGPSSRLERRLVQELRLAESVDVYLEPRALGSVFHVEVTGVSGADLERVKREAIAAIADLAANGPTDAELRRVKAQTEVEFRKEREHLLRRADRLNLYRAYLGDADGFERDLARHARATAAGVRDAARTLGEGRVDLRIYPAGAAPGAIPDHRPADLAAATFVPPAPEVFRLANGIEVRAVPQRGTGLFAGHLVLEGGERAVPPAQAGASGVVSRLVISGAAGRSAPEFADAIRTLGASLEVHPYRTALDVEVTGLSAKLEPTLDLVADALMRPNLAAADFDREAALARARVEARASQPAEVARVAGAAALFGEADLRGRAVDGYARTLSTLTLADVRELAPRLLSPRGAVLVFAGDFDVAALRRALEARFGRWQPRGAAPPRAPAALSDARGGRIVFVDRPGAPQTVIYAVRPAATVEGTARAAREIVNVAIGGSFTSRLNQNLREKHGYTYGAHSAFVDDGGQVSFVVTASVQTEVTGAALVEVRRELDALAAGGLSPAEAAKARETARNELVQSVQTSQDLARTLAEHVLEGRPADALRRSGAALAEIDPARADAEARRGPYPFGGMTLVLVGDRAAVLPQLEKAGFAAPVFADAEGRPVAAVSVLPVKQ